MAQDHGAASVEMVAEAHQARLRPHQAAQHLLAAGQAQAGQIVAVQVQQVESIEGEAVAAAFAQVGLESREVRRAGIRLDDQFAVDQGSPGGQRLQGGHDRLAEPARPVEPAARQQLHATALDPCLQAIAVELDLVQPARAGRRLGHQGRQRGLHESRHGGLAGALDLRRIGPLDGLRRGHGLGRDGSRSLSRLGDPPGFR